MSFLEAINERDGGVCLDRYFEMWARKENLCSRDAALGEIAT